jgi:hypothetical protein
METGQLGPLLRQLGSLFQDNSPKTMQLVFPVSLQSTCNVLCNKGVCTRAFVKLVCVIKIIRQNRHFS